MAYNGLFGMFYIFFRRIETETWRAYDLFGFRVFFLSVGFKFSNRNVFVPSTFRANIRFWVVNGLYAAYMGVGGEKHKRNEFPDK